MNEVTGFYRNGPPQLRSSTQRGLLLWLTLKNLGQDPSSAALGFSASQNVPTGCVRVFDVAGCYHRGARLAKMSLDAHFRLEEIQVLAVRNQANGLLKAVDVGTVNIGGKKNH